MTNDYKSFLAKKVVRVRDVGFDILDSEYNQYLFPFQRRILELAVRKGRYAVFADCGLGKTLIQLNWAQVISARTNQPVLIICPLAVSGQTIAEGQKFGIQVTKAMEPTDVQAPGVYITNYERIGKFDCRAFSGVVLDESSILKNFAGAIRNKLITAFADTPYKLCCTATPSPNDFMEFGNHSEFLNVMRRNEMLSYFFVHDMDDTQSWRLKGHAVQDFYDWMSGWAIFLSQPSDIGFSDEGFILPPLKMIERKVITRKTDNGSLFNDVAVDATNHNAELRRTQEERIRIAAEIANGSPDSFIIWVKHNGEGAALRKLIPEAVEVSGSDDPEEKERRLLGFAKGEFRVLITKAKIAQFGMNYQNCHNQIFASLDFSFESLYQAIRRSYRFMQTSEVNIYLITTDTMQNVIQSIRQKEAAFSTLKDNMRNKMHSGFEAYHRQEVTGEDTAQGKSFIAKRGDCVELIRGVADNSIHLSIFSPPFADLYTYSDHPNDMGNCRDYDEFAQHFSFLIPELLRVMMPGRLVAIHCMDMPIVKQREGFIGVRDFPGMLIKAFQDQGFIFHCRVTIWKDPVTAMQRTKALGLLHKQVKKDSSMSRTGLADYLVVMRKHGDNPEPISNIKIPVSVWQKYASPVWMDINQTNTLQYRSARADKDEKHICPLQLEVIERATILWSNEGDTVLSPFMGIGSEGYVALGLGRKFIGFELKDSYFAQAVKNLESVKRYQQVGLFDQPESPEQTTAA